MKATVCLDAAHFSDLSSAIAALPNEGGEVSLPARTYDILEPLVVDKPNVTLIGAAGGGTLLRRRFPSGTPEEERLVLVVRAPGFKMQGVGVDVSGTGEEASS